MRLGDRRGEACGVGLGSHACYLNSGHSGPHKCSPYCGAGHPKTTLAWVYDGSEWVAKPPGRD